MLNSASNVCDGIGESSAPLRSASVGKNDVQYEGVPPQASRTFDVRHHDRLFARQGAPALIADSRPFVPAKKLAVFDGTEPFRPQFFRPRRPDSFDELKGRVEVQHNSVRFEIPPRRQVSTT